MKKVHNSPRQKFTDFVKQKGTVPMMLIHRDSKPAHLMTLADVVMRYDDQLTPNTIKQYAHTGAFPYPVAVMMGESALSWLFDEKEVKEYFVQRITFSQEEYDKLMEQSRALNAQGARLRYRANKMKQNFILTIKESK